MLDLSGECSQPDKRNRRVLNPRRFLTPDREASRLGGWPRHDGLQSLRRWCGQVLSPCSGCRRFVQNLQRASNVRDAENQKWLIRTRLAPAVGIVDVDISFTEL